MQRPDAPGTTTPARHQTWLSRFDAVLLDMSGTFMFGHDRLGEGENFAATYRVLGGHLLRDMQVTALIRETITRMTVRYAGQSVGFPKVLDVLSDVVDAEHADELPRLADVIARHEAGTVPAEYARALRTLAGQTRLAVVSNLWSHKGVVMERLHEAGLAGTFEALVFSSDGPYIKPAPQLFEAALTALGVSPARAVYVGDDPIRDIAGARSVGMSTVLVGPHACDANDADRCAASLLELIAA